MLIAPQREAPAGRVDLSAFAAGIPRRFDLARVMRTAIASSRDRVRRVAVKLLSAEDAAPSRRRLAPSSPGALAPRPDGPVFRVGCARGADPRVASESVRPLGGASRARVAVERMDRTSSSLPWTRATLPPSTAAGDRAPDSPRSGRETAAFSGTGRKLKELDDGVARGGYRLSPWAGPPARVVSDWLPPCGPW